MAKAKSVKRGNGELVTAIRFHLNGKVEISPDHGQTWKPFDGMLINAALIEYNEELNHMRREGRFQ